MAKILVVDDAAFMRTVLKEILTKEGHTIVEASNGQEMLRRYEEYSPDLVTMDITMPIMNGIEGVKLLKEKYSDAQIIMCSAMGQKIMVLDALRYGAKDFIVKPFNPDRVIEAVNKVLAESVGRK